MLELKPHQIEAAQYLSSAFLNRGLLADPPGMMKTLSVIHGMALAEVRRPLVVCPAVVRTHWQRSFAEYHAAFPKAFPSLDVVVKSYDEINRGGDRLKQELIDPAGFSRDMMHLDEFHFLKHATAQRTKRLLGRDGYIRHFGMAWGSSGTPLDKNPTNIWTILSSFMPHLALKYGVPSFKAFVEKFAVWEYRTIRRQKRVVHFLPTTKQPEVFAELLSEMWLRRESLPGVEALWSITRLDGVSHVADYTCHSDALKDALKQANGDALRAIASDPETARARRRLGEHKAPPVVALVTSELENSDEKIVIFAHHRSVLDALRLGLSQFAPAYLDGSTSSTKRQSEIDRFVNDPSCRIFIGQNVACGTGMDGLQYSGARRMLLVEMDWGHVLNTQLAARLARHGQQHQTVAVQCIALAGTLDEGIVGLNKREAEFLGDMGL